MASLFSIVNARENICQDLHAHHYGGTERWRKGVYFVVKHLPAYPLSESCLTMEHVQGIHFHGLIRKTFTEGLSIRLYLCKERKKFSCSFSPRHDWLRVTSRTSATDGYCSII